MRGGSGAHAHTRTSWSSRSKASHVVWAPKRSPVGRTCASSTNDSDAVWNLARLSKHPLSVVQHERSTTLLVWRCDVFIISAVAGRAPPRAERARGRADARRAGGGVRRTEGMEGGRGMCVGRAGRSARAPRGVGAIPLCFSRHVSMRFSTFTAAASSCLII